MADDNDQPFPAKDRRATTTADGLGRVRGQAATVLRVLFVVCAVILAVGAFLVAVRNNVSADNAVVRFVWHVADAIDGPFSRDHGIFVFHGKNAVTKDAVVNWGIAAIVYLVIGNVVQRLLRPTGRR